MTPRRARPGRSVSPREVRDLGDRGAYPDGDFPTVPELDVGPVGLFDLGDHAVVGHEYFDRQAGDAREVGIRQRLVPDLEQLSERERPGGIRSDVDSPRGLVGVDRVEAVASR